MAGEKKETIRFTKALKLNLSTKRSGGKKCKVSLCGKYVSKTNFTFLLSFGWKHSLQFLKYKCSGSRMTSKNNKNEIKCSNIVASADEKENFAHTRRLSRDHVLQFSNKSLSVFTSLVCDCVFESGFFYSLFFPFWDFRNEILNSQRNK